MPRVMVEMFVKEHLRVDHVVGSELVVNQFGLATGFLRRVVIRSLARLVSCLGMSSLAWGWEEPSLILHSCLCAR